MPATVGAGDLLLVLIAYVSNGTCVAATPSGWLKLWDSEEGGSVRKRGAGFAKVAAGTEDGTTVNFSTDINATASAHCYRVTDWFGALSGGVEAGTAVP
jgi:hypothetical protein